MNYQFSEKVSQLQASAIREILKYTADPEVISFAAGNPAPEAFPISAVKEISARMLEEEPIPVLQYGITEGYMPLRQQVKERMAEKFGIGERYDMTVVAGPHGWKESSRRSSLDWMRRWLMGEKPTRTEADYRALDAGFDLKAVDCGLPAEEVNVTPTGNVADIPGARSVYDIMRDEALAHVKAPVLELKDEIRAAHIFYTSRDPAEEKAMLCQMLGTSLVEERMKYIFDQAKKKDRPFLYAHGSWCVPARKAYEKSPELFAGVMTVDDRNFADAVRGELKPARGR